MLPLSAFASTKETERSDRSVSADSPNAKWFKFNACARPPRTSLPQRIVQPHSRYPKPIFLLSSHDTRQQPLVRRHFWLGPKAYRKNE